MNGYRVRHTTDYTYAEAVAWCHNVAHLKPRITARQQVEATSLTVLPAPAMLEERRDYFGNVASYFVVQEPHTQLIITAEHHLRVAATPADAFAAGPPWEQIRDCLRAARRPEALAACQFAFDSHYIERQPEYAAYARSSFTRDRGIVEAVRDLTTRIHREFVYDPRATTIATPVARVFAQRRGVCQDFAHFQIACLRSLGLAARYVSGYLSTLPPPGKEKLIGADATHAWLALWCGPELGWIDLDPTNDLLVSDRHLLLGWGRDYDDVSPVKGIILGGGSHTVSVSVDVASA